MEKFKYGDTVRFIGKESGVHKGLVKGETYDFNGYALPTDVPWITIKGYRNDNNDGSYVESVFELANIIEPKSPIQEEVVTKRKLVRGIYGIVMVQEATAETPKDHIAIRIDRSIRGASAEELEEASHILAQLAEFLRSEEK